MDANKDIKRLFFGLELEAAWMHPLPEGRILEEKNRHMTLAFLGNTSHVRIQKDLVSFPAEKGLLGFAGICDSLLFLPPANPHVVSGHIEWSDSQEFLHFYKELNSWLSTHGYPVEAREMLPHATIARAPFVVKNWKKAFQPFPVIAKSLNLFESLGNLNYNPIWNIPFLLPIEEISHTADLAFRIRGKDIPQLFQNARLALAFKFPELINYFSDTMQISDLDDLIIQLNKMVSKADAEIGCPFKAVSFHGTINNDNAGHLMWEMIVDV